VDFQSTLKYSVQTSKKGYVEVEIGSFVYKPIILFYWSLQLASCVGI